METVGFTQEKDPWGKKKKDAFVAQQATYITRILHDLNLKGIDVDPAIHTLEPTFFRDRRVLAYTGIGDSTVGILVSNETNNNVQRQDEHPITPILISPTQTDSGLLIDEKSKTIWTDSFWVYHNKKFRYVRPTVPIQIDGYNPMFDTKRPDPVFDEWDGGQQRLQALVKDKQKTKELLSDAGIRVPTGIFLTAEDSNIDEQIDNFLETFPDLSGIVVKANTGSHGYKVKIFDLTNPEAVTKAKRATRELMEGNRGVIIEERITPPPASKLKLKRLRRNGKKGVDYNFRVLTTLDTDNPEVIDAEIRFREKSITPVNISIDAKAAIVDTLDDPALVERIFAAARATTSVVCAEVGTDLHGVVGIDLISDANKNVYVLEANAGAVGGLGTLIRLLKRPLPSINEKLVPSTAPYLEKRFQRRIPLPPQRLKRIPQNVSDHVTLLYTQIEAKDYNAALDILFQREDLFDSQRDYISPIFFLADKAGNYDKLLAYIDRKLEESPEDYQLKYDKILALRKAKRFDQAQAKIHALPDEIFTSQVVMYEQFLLFLARGDTHRADAFLENFIREGHEPVGLLTTEKKAKFFSEAYKALGKKRKALLWKFAAFSAPETQLTINRMRRLEEELAEPVNE
ncbi:MAG: hypothetical protein AAB553_01000 [Patescibacteria group bacterium]